MLVGTTGKNCSDQSWHEEADRHVHLLERRVRRALADVGLAVDHRLRAMSSFLNEVISTSTPRFFARSAATSSGRSSMR
jgi:hypothetical protein